MTVLDETTQERFFIKNIKIVRGSHNSVAIRTKTYPNGRIDKDELYFEMRSGIAFSFIKDAPMMLDTAENYGIDRLPEFDKQKHIAAYCAFLDSFMQEYRKNEQPHTDEQLGEMRAAFGKGTVVVDVLSGRKTKL